MAANWFEELESLEKVVEIFEILGGKNEPRVASLVTPYRRFVDTIDAQLREAPFSSTAKVPTRTYAFRDLLLVARPNNAAAAGIGRKTTQTFAAQQMDARGPAESVASTASKSTMGPSRRSFRISFGRKKSAAALQGARSGSGAAPNLSGPNPHLEELEANRAKLLHWFPLHECREIKPVPRSDGNEFGFQLTHVTRQTGPISMDQPHATTSGASASASAAATATATAAAPRVTTRVAKYEFWFPSEQDRDAAMHRIANLVLECQEKLAAEVAATAAGSANGAPTPGPKTPPATSDDETGGAPKMRSWAKNRPKSGRSLTATSVGSLAVGAGAAAAAGDSDEDNARRGSDTSMLMGGGGGGGGGEAVLTLQDLERRYNVDFAAQAKGHLDRTTALNVEFDEGAMGFSLSSGPGVGVIVSRLAPGSFADLAGVFVGDRISAVNGIDVDLETTWQKCVEMLRAVGRPVTLTFLRNAAVAEKVEEMEAAASSAASPTAASASANASGGASTSTSAASASTAPSSHGDGPGGGGGGGASAAGAAAGGNPGKRRWARNRDDAAVRAAAGLISLQEVERMYKTVGGKGDLLSAPLDPPLPSSAVSSASLGGGIENKDDDDPPSTSGGGGGGGEDEPTLASARDVARSVSSAAVGSGGAAKGFRHLLTELVERASKEEERQCFGLVKEIIETEKNYVTDLRELIKEYIVPLRRATKRYKCREKEEGSLLCEHSTLRSGCTKTSSESGPLLSPDDVRVIFMNTETLVQINYELFKAISEGVEAVCTEYLATASESSTDVDVALCKCMAVVSSAFLRIQSLLSMYALYCHQYPAATERLQLVRAREEEVDAFLRKRESRSTQTSLRSLLIKPVQRICRYPLLFQELVKRLRKLETAYASEDDPRRAEAVHGTFVDLERTAEIVDRVATNVNKKVDEQGSNQKMLDAYYEMGGPDGGERIAQQLLAPSRRFVKAYEVFFREAPFDVEPLPVKLYLFNDLAVVGTEREKNLVGGGPLGSRGTLGGGGGGGGGGGLGSRSKSRSRGLSLGNLLMGVRRPSLNSGLVGGESKEEGGAADGSAAAAPQKPWTMKQTHWFELSALQIRPLLNPDEAGWWGCQLKYVQRSLVDVPSSSGGAGSSKKSQPQAPQQRVVTSVLKYEVWMPIKEDLDALLTEIEDRIGFLEIQQQNAELGKELYGAGGPKRTRSWAARKTARSVAASSVDSFGGGAGAGGGGGGGGADEEGGADAPASASARSRTLSFRNRGKSNVGGVRFDAGAGVDAEQAKNELEARYRRVANPPSSTSTALDVS